MIMSDDAGADRGEKGRGAVDGAGQHRADQDDEDRVEGGFLRERTPVADPDDGESDDENDEAAQEIWSRVSSVALPSGPSRD